MPSPISVFIEMPSWQKKYLLSESENKQEPIIFSPRHDYNILLIRLISNDTSIKEPDHHQPGVKIRLPFNEVKDIYFYNKISRDDRIIFRAQVARDMYYDFRVFLKDMIMAGEERKVALERFFEAHNITDEDLNYESFYRSYTRFLKNRRLKYCNSAFTQFSRKSVHRILKETA